MSTGYWRCNTETCDLGADGQPGLFTAGIEQTQAQAIAADPDAPYGDGYCPTCGQPGEEVI